MVIRTGARGPAHPAARRRPDRAGGPGLRAAVRPGQRAARSPSRSSCCPGGNCAPALPSGSGPPWRSCRRTSPRASSYQIVYDPTVFVSESIREVVITLFEAVLLVVVVVVLFLQTWRASSFRWSRSRCRSSAPSRSCSAFGFSINTLTLFGLVLAIGIVVDDAIVVVENVERNIELGLEPKQAAYRAMEEVTGPIIAIALVLCAVFVPVALVPGFTGQFYRQFALTIAFSTVISAINSLTLSPALAAILLRPHDAPRDRLTRVLDRGLGWIFRPFNRFFKAGSERYGRGSGAPRHPAGLAARSCTPGCWRSRWWSSGSSPEGSSPRRTSSIWWGSPSFPTPRRSTAPTRCSRKMTAIALEHPAVSHAVQFTGLSVNGFVNAPNQGLVFFPLKPFEEREEPELHGPAVAQALNGALRLDSGGVRRGVPATADPGAWVHRRLQDAGAGSRRAGRASAVPGLPGADRPGQSAAPAARRLLQLPDERAPGLDRHRPGAGPAPGRGASRSLLHPGRLPRARPTSTTSTGSGGPTRWWPRPTAPSGASSRTSAT